MGGLYRLFLKITPIMLLICCICYGIIHVFQTNNEEPITYLRAETINIGTEEQPDNKTLYTFDMVSYTQNIDQNILKRAVTNTLDFQTYNAVLRQFNVIWENGYEFGDVTKTILNASILIINTLILPINIVLTPIRITAGILLTGISIVGINVNANTAINNTLKGILDYAVIPLIPPTYAKQTEEQIVGSQYIMKDNPPSQYYEVIRNWISPGGWIYHYTNYNINVYFTSQNGGNYKNIKTSYEYNSQDQQYHFKIWYTDTDNYEILVYDNAWIYQDSRYITINPNQNLSNSDYQQLAKYLSENANQQYTS